MFHLIPYFQTLLPSLCFYTNSNQAFIDGKNTKETLDDRRSVEEKSNLIQYSCLIAKNDT